MIDHNSDEYTRAVLDQIAAEARMDAQREAEMQFAKAASTLGSLAVTKVLLEGDE